MRFEKLKDCSGPLAQCAYVTCKATGEIKKWHDAVALGWCADLDGEPFKDYYSPTGQQLVREIEAETSK